MRVDPTLPTTKYRHYMPIGKYKLHIIILQEPGFIIGMMFLGLKAVFFFDQIHQVPFGTKMQFWSDSTKLNILSPHYSYSNVHWHTLKQPMHQLSSAGKLCRLNGILTYCNIKYTLGTSSVKFSMIMI